MTCGTAREFFPRSLHRALSVPLPITGQGQQPLEQPVATRAKAGRLRQEMAGMATLWRRHFNG